MAAPIKILFFVHSLQLAGAERQVTVLASGLMRRGHQVSVASRYAGGPFEDELRLNGVTIHRIGAETGLFGLGRFLLRLARVLHNEAPDIIHSYMEVPNFFAVLLKPFAPKATIVWGVRSSVIHEFSNSVLWQAFQYLSKKLARFTDLIIVNSQRGKERLLSLGYPEERIRLVHNGVDTNCFQPDPAARARFRADLGITSSEAVAGLVGRLDALKDYPCFLQAGAIACERIPELRLICVGDGPAKLRLQLETLVEALHLTGRVTFLPARRDIASVYNGLDLLVSSSSSEGFPNVIAEAMACGVPCVATDVGDSRLIVDDSLSIVPPARPGLLAAAMERAILGRRGVEADRCRERILNKFSLRTLIESTEQLLLHPQSENSLSS